MKTTGIKRQNDLKIDRLSCDGLPEQAHLIEKTKARLRRQSGYERDKARRHRFERV